MRCSCLRLCTAACAVLGLWASSHAHPILTFIVTSHVEQPQRTPSDETFPLIVTLGHEYLSVDAQGNRTIYDFEHSRLYELNLAGHTFNEFSLYSNIGFRVLEFHNRLTLGKGLTAGGVKTPKTETPLLEQLFSLLDDQSHSAIVAKHSGAETVYQWQKHRLASVSNRVAELAPEYQAEYWRFLRYYAGGHPRIFEALKPLSGVPEVVTFELVNFNTETRTMVLQNLASTPDQAFSLDGFTRAAPQQEPYLTLALVAADAPRRLADRMTATRQDRDLAFSQGRYLDSLLAFQESFLSTGFADKEWLLSARDHLTRDIGSMKLTSALANKDPLQAQVAADALASLRAAATIHTDVIDIFEGNARLGLNQSSRGVGLLLAAVKTDPI